MELGKAEGMELGKAEGVELGISQGVELGMSTLLCKQAAQRWGMLPPQTEAQLRRIKNTQDLEDLSLALMSASSLKEFEASIVSYVHKAQGGE